LLGVAKMKNYYLFSKIKYPKYMYILYYEKKDNSLVVYFDDGHQEIFIGDVEEIEKCLLEWMEDQLYFILDLQEKNLFWNWNSIVYPLNFFVFSVFGQLLVTFPHLSQKGLCLQSLKECGFFATVTIISFLLFRRNAEKFVDIRKDFEKYEIFLKMRNRLHNYRIFEPQLLTEALNNISEDGRKILATGEEITVNSIHNVSKEDIATLSRTL